jgi:HTH-type transcriptional regulator, sugar sensing transcriptional regulator
MNNHEYLQNVGLTNGEVKVYYAVLELGISSLNNIHEKTGIERRNIYDILNKLIEKGLISYTIEKGKKTFQVTHPNKILSYLDDKKHNIDNVKKEVKSHISELIHLFNLSKTEIRAEVFRGDEAIKALLTEILEHNESCWMGGNSFENYKAVSENLMIWFAHWMQKRVKKKRWMYDLVSHGTWLKGLEPNKKSEHKKHYYKYGQLPKGFYVPMVIIIFDNKVAQIIWSEQSFAFVIEGEKIKESFMQYFNFFWDKR